MKRYLEIIIENSVAAIDRPYTYICHDDSIGLGDAVEVSFGRGSRKGFVFGEKNSVDIDESKLKEVTKGEGNVLSPEAVKLCIYMKKYCFCRYIDGVKCFIPPGYFSFEDIISPVDGEESRDFAANPGRSKKQGELLSMLLKYGPAKKAEIRKSWGFGYETMRAVVEKGYAIEGRIEKKRVPMRSVLADREAFIDFTPEQAVAFEKLKDSIHEEKYKGYLLWGVTGSGKTRVYIEAIREALSLGRTAIILVPEISLTIQAIERFRGEFGDQVAILHSKLSDGERYDEWIRIKRGEAKIVLGVRSAIFAPLENIGVIVVDEEHESSYKADNSPRYDAIEIAAVRAKYNNAVLVLGSATPQITTFRLAEEGRLELLTMKNRYNDIALPAVHIADMRAELKRGNKSVFSERLYVEMKRCLAEKRQIILFLNRRGFSSFISCRNCGYVMKCPDCGISLTYHKQEQAAVCHYCGRKFRIPVKCPDCGSEYIKDFGTGTEKIEELCRKIFPNARAARLDLDTMSKKGSTESILDDFKNHRTDILIGTQVVAKGLDYEAVDLVGIIAADISLNIPDYRSAEKAFQLITQAAGRSGRGNKRGQVVIQTYNPDHYAVRTASMHDYESFYREEIKIRMAMKYPPFGDIIRVMTADVNEGIAGSCARSFCDEIKARFGQEAEGRLLGPKAAHILKIKGRYRYQVLIKAGGLPMKELYKALHEIRQKLLNEGFKTCNITIEVNPHSTI